MRKVVGVPEMAACTLPLPLALDALVAAVATSTASSAVAAAAARIFGWVRCSEPVCIVSLAAGCGNCTARLTREIAGRDRNLCPGGLDIPPRTLGRTSSQARGGVLLDARCERLRVPDARDHGAQPHALSGQGGVDAGADVEAPVAVHPAPRERLPASVVADLDAHRAAGAGAARAHAAVDAHDARPVRAGGVERRAAGAHPHAAVALGVRCGLVAAAGFGPGEGVALGAVAVGGDREAVEQ